MALTGIMDKVRGSRPAPLPWETIATLVRDVSPLLEESKEIWQELLTRRTSQQQLEDTLTFAVKHRRFADYTRVWQESLASESYVARLQAIQAAGLARLESVVETLEPAWQQVTAALQRRDLGPNRREELHGYQVVLQPLIDGVPHWLGKMRLVTPQESVRER